MGHLNTVAAGPRAHSVRFYLVLLALAVAIPLAGLSFYVSARIAAAERESTEAALLNNAGSLAAAVDQEIDKHIAVAATLAHSKSLLDGDWAQFWQRAKDSFDQLPDSWLILLDPDGQVLVNTRLPFGRALPRRPLFDAERQALRTGKPAVSDVVMGFGTRRLKSFAVVPVYRDGHIAYLLDITLSPDRFVALLQNQKYLTNWLAAIVDHSNHFVARLPDAEGTKLGQPASAGWQNAIEQNPSGVVYHVATDGHRIIDGYTHTAYGWTVGIGIRESILKAPLRRTQWMLVAACLGCIGLGVLFAWLVARRLHRSAMQLQKAATAIASEQPLNVAPTGVSEYDDAVAAIAVASQALHARAQERDRAEAALARAAEENAALYEFTNRLYRAESLSVVYQAAIDAILRALHCNRASVLRPDETGTMRFVAWRGLSDGYRAAVDGHSPWAAGETNPQPICIGDVEHTDLPEAIKTVVKREGIRALSFIPLVSSDGKVAGKFMTYYETPHAFSRDEIELALNLARRLGFAAERMQAEQARQIAERELRQLKEKLETEVRERTRERDRIWSVSEDLLGVSTFAGHFVSINPAWTRLLGWSEAEIKMMHVTDLRHPDDAEASIAGRAQLAHGVGTVRMENRFRHKDGSWRWIHWTMTAEEGLIYVSGRHVTLEKEAAAALERANQRSAHAQKMEALGALTGGVAHDFNNLLMIVSGHAQSLKRRLTEPKDKRSLEAIQIAATRGENLTRQLLSFSRVMPLNPTVISPAGTIDAFRDVLSGTLHVNIELAINVPATTWPVRIDKSELELALVNLAVNASDAMPSGGRLSISAENVRLNTDDTPEGLAGDFIALSVSDTGSGIAEEVIGRVFEPFFTTKGADKGTGLGLSQVYGFARRSGGTAVVRSALDHGTTVTLYLPRSHAAVEQPLQEDVTQYAAPAGATVLVVEDNADVRAVTVSLLEQLGYHTVAVEHATAALEALAQARGVNIVFSDVVLPGQTDGLLLARAVKARYPDIPVVLTTGYARVFDTEPEFPVLRKPYQISALGRVIREALDAANGKKTALAS
jgi:PAS domain S-box-containing protein